MRFSLEKLSKIENSYVSQVGKSRNLTEYKKKRNFCQVEKKKNKFSVQTYGQKSENVHSLSSSDDITLSAEWTSAALTLPPHVTTSWAFSSVPKNLIFLQNGGTRSVRGKSVTPTGEHVGRKLNYLFI